MRGILCAAVAAALSGLPLAARAEEPRGSIIDRGREVVQACFHKHCDRRDGSGGSCSSCASSCNSCSQDDARIGKLVDTLFYAERPSDRKNAALRLDKCNWTEHPEVVAALTYAMQSDCDRGVRIAAADSLKDMRVCDPDSIDAMQFTRAEDPSWRVRYKAKWGIIKGEESRPPCLAYVSGHEQRASSPGGHEAPAPQKRLEPVPVPAPRPMPIPERKQLDDNENVTEAKGGIGSR